MQIVDPSRPGQLMHGLVLVLGLGPLMAPPAAQAAAVYAQHWDGPASTQGWASNAVQSLVVGDATSGDPAGSLSSVFNSDGFHVPVIGMQSGDVEALRGDFGSQVWSVSFDLRRLQGSGGELFFRYRFHSASHDGWRLPLALPVDDDWVHVSFAFDAAWTDAEAGVAGWQRDMGETATFAQTLGDVFYTELRWELPDTATTALLGLDNFVQAPTTVPVPATAALVALALPWALRRRRR